MKCILSQEQQNMCNGSQWNTDFQKSGKIFLMILDEMQIVTRRQWLHEFKKL